MPELTLPLTKTGRKYGYIMWQKAEEPRVRELLGEGVGVALLLPGNVEKLQNVDWKHRRISLGYTQTRTLPDSTRSIHLKTTESGKIEVSFR